MKGVWALAEQALKQAICRSGKTYFEVGLEAKHKC